VIDLYPYGSLWSNRFISESIEPSDPLSSPSAEWDTGFEKLKNIGINCWGVDIDDDDDDDDDDNWQLI
jgi:hypothetical protein